MNIHFYEKEHIFKLDTVDTSYIFGIVDTGFLGHMYYGPKLMDYQLDYTLRLDEIGLPSKNRGYEAGFFDELRTEYSTHGLGDYRESCLQIETMDGFSACGLKYVSHQIYEGKHMLEGLPATYGTKDDCTSLEIVCEDPIEKLQVILVYTAFQKIDAITRSVRVVNQGNQSIFLKKVLSFCLDMDNCPTCAGLGQGGFDMITLHGTWAKERHVHRRDVGYGKQSIGSIRGQSSQQENPFLALVSKNTTEESGEVYGFHFVYSGNFLAQVERTEGDHLRVVMGIHPDHFKWKLSPGECFTAPEAVMTYSHEGIGKMTHTFHDLYRNHLIRGQYKHIKRPILLNNWEATYFNFNTEKLLELAKKASSLGIEMLVMDDGWFGKRNDDKSSLGDWYVNEEKLPGGLTYLADELDKMGMKFGIWMEPEMVSEDSDTYREHPDWIIHIPGRKPMQSRNQYVLDLSRKEVRESIYKKIHKVLKSAKISYVKWDMNRSQTDLGSAALPVDRQGELSHRYMLGVYELQERLLSDFPDLLLENCASGGGRFDPGMLYYSPQIWCSDDTDAMERLEIQHGTEIVYPLSSIGAHVSACPNHQLNRTTPFETRGHIALAGTFGYELDVTNLSKQEEAMIKEQVKMYQKYHNLIAEGDYYRIANASETNEYDCFMVASKDQKEALVFYIQTMKHPACRSKRVRLKGLNPSFTYCMDGRKKTFSGEALMYAGLPVQNPDSDYASELIYLRRQE